MIAFKLRIFFLTINKLITEIFTQVKARNAPKLINEATRDKLKNNADKDNTLINNILFVGVLNFGCNLAKNAGNWPSRPIAYKTLAALACDDRAEPSTTTAVIARKALFKKLPPTNPIMS